MIFSNFKGMHDFFFLLCVFGGLLVNVRGVCVCVLQDMVCGGKDNFQKSVLYFHNLGDQTQSSLTC